MRGYWLETGSSPRTWGTPDGTSHRDCRSRFIPTHVGNATEWRIRSSVDPVHPHARGERGLRGGAPLLLAGSSPRTWGTLADGVAARVDRRFIPTHVGNASPEREPSSPAPVHPHARGERRSYRRAAWRTAGSSPRTWGTHAAAHHRGKRRRFIPTHVGNAGGAWPNQTVSAVHPHARGERHRASSPAYLPRGSSPRTWGTH